MPDCVGEGGKTTLRVDFQLIACAAGAQEDESSPSCESPRPEGTPLWIPRTDILYGSNRTFLLLLTAGAENSVILLTVRQSNFRHAVPPETQRVSQPVFIKGRRLSPFMRRHAQWHKIEK